MWDECPIWAFVRYDATNVPPAPDPGSVSNLRRQGRGAVTASGQLGFLVPPDADGAWRESANCRCDGPKIVLPRGRLGRSRPTAGQAGQVRCVDACTVRDACLQFAFENEAGGRHLGRYHRGRAAPAATGLGRHPPPPRRMTHRGGATPGHAPLRSRDDLPPGGARCRRSPALPPPWAGDRRPVLTSNLERTKERAYELSDNAADHLRHIRRRRLGLEIHQAPVTAVDDEARRLGEKRGRQGVAQPAPETLG